MSKVVFFVGFICALLFVNVYAYESLKSADGKYKHDAILAFTKVLKKLEDFTLPAGDAMLEKWIAGLKEINENLNAGDVNAATEVAHGAMSVLTGILPAIPDKSVYAAIESIPEAFEKDLKRAVVEGISIDDVDRFVQFATNVMLDAMSKRTPTAETLAL